MAGKKSPRGAYNPYAGGGGAPRRGRRTGARHQGGPTNPNTWNHMHIVNEGVPFTTFPFNWGESLGTQMGTQTGKPVRGRRPAARRRGARQQGPHTHQYTPAPHTIHTMGLNSDMRKSLRHKHGTGDPTSNLEGVDWLPYDNSIGFTNPLPGTQTTLSPGGTHQHGLSTGPGNTQMGTPGGRPVRGRGRPAAKRRAPRRRR